MLVASHNTTESLLLISRPGLLLHVVEDEEQDALVVWSIVDRTCRLCLFHDAYDREQLGEACRALDGAKVLAMVQASIETEEFADDPKPMPRSVGCGVGFARTLGHTILAH